MHRAGRPPLLRNSLQLQRRRQQLEPTGGVISTISHAAAVAQNLRPPGIATVLAVAGRRAARQAQATRCLARWHRPATRRRSRDHGVADHVVRQARAGHWVPGRRARARRASALATARLCWPDSAQTHCGPCPAWAHRDAAWTQLAGAMPLPAPEHRPASRPDRSHSVVVVVADHAAPAVARAAVGRRKARRRNWRSRPGRALRAMHRWQRLWSVSGPSSISLAGWRMRVLHAHGNGGLYPLGQGERCIVICRAFAAARRSLACAVMQRARPGPTPAPCCIQHAGALSER